MFVNTDLKFFWKFILISVVVIGCNPDVKKHATKPESFHLVFNNDTVRVTFSNDSSLVKMETLPQWGFLKRFGYKDDNVELYFSFFEDQRERVSQISDSVLINNRKLNYRFIGYKGDIMYTKKVTKNNLYGILAEYGHENGKIYFFTGEFMEHHLSFDIEVFQNGTVQHRPEMLNDIINSLKISIIPR